MEYLGHIVSKGGIKPQLSKINAIVKMTPPKNRKDIQIFLGMVGYYCRFIKNFSGTALPLFHLLKKESIFIWNEACQESFDALRTALVSLPVLAYPNFNKIFIIQTNASLYAIGAVLSQEGEDGQEHPIAFISHVLNEHEKNYTVTEYECLAIIYACKQFYIYIHGVYFKVITDHASL